MIEGEISTIRGRVRVLDHVLEAPLSGAACVAYSTYRRDYFADQGNSDQVRFAVETRSGPVVVDGPLKLRIAPLSLFPRQVERERAFLAIHSEDADVRTATFTERILAPGSNAVVRGLLVVSVEAPNAAQLYRDVHAVRRIVPHNGVPIVVKQRGWWDVRR